MILLLVAFKEKVQDPFKYHKIVSVKKANKNQIFFLFNQEESSFIINLRFIWITRNEPGLRWGGFPIL